MHDLSTHQMIHLVAGLTESCASYTKASMKHELEIVQTQKAQASQELEGLEKRRLELEQWIRDLSVTERTLARLADIELPPGSDGDVVSASKRKKPSNAPSIYEMAVTIIRDRAEDTVEAQEIVAGIRRRWWPDATNNDVSPTLWRLATKDGRLRKVGTSYGLPLVSSPAQDG